jgi:hypothetical protein
MFVTSLLPIWITLLAGLLPLLLPGGWNFEYEYSLYAAWFEVLLWVTARVLVKGDPWRNRPVFLFHLLTFYAPLISLIPGVLIFVTQSCACNPIGYLMWWGLLWAPARSVGFILFTVSGSFLSKRTVLKRMLWCFAAYAFMWFLLGLSLWVFPQKRLVHAFFGFLHGPIYDAYIALDTGVVLRRTSLIALSVGVLCFYYIKDVYNRRCLSLAFFMVFLAMVLGSGRYTSTQVGHQALRSEFLNVSEGSHSKIYFNTLANDGLKVKYLLTQADTHLLDLMSILQIEASSAPKVGIYLYDDAKHKKIAFGGYNTDIADVFGVSIHITRSRLPHPTLRHELVHALLADKAPLGLGFRLNMAITEGVAVALEAPPNERSIHELAAALVLGKEQPVRLEDLFSPWFWRQPSGHAYGVAGSFFKFLLQQYGGPKLLALYSGSSFAATYSKSLAELEAEWIGHLESAFRGSLSTQYFVSVLSQKSHLDRRCPHSRNINKRPKSEGLWVRLRQPLGWDPESDYFPWVVSNFRNAGIDEVADVDFAFLKSRIDQEMAQKKYEQLSVKKWLVDSASLMREPMQSRLQARIRILRSDLLALDDRWDESEKLLEETVASVDGQALGYDLIRAAQARLRLASLTEVELSKQWRRYLAGWRSSPPGFQGQGKPPWIAEYLYLRALKNRVPTGSSLQQLVEKLPEIPLHNSFYFEYFRKIAEIALFEKKNTSVVERARGRAQQYATKNQIEYLNMLGRLAAKL